LVLVPAFLMVSTLRFRSVKAIEVGWRRSYVALFLAAVAIALVTAQPRIALVALSYTYLGSAFIGWIIGRVRRRGAEPPPQPKVSSSG
jgi:phosphatidylserine synthase